ncbi:MAG: hypothetical protein HY898_03785 [Deltaproteobacteria bacterium]|jgi:hypothetical protein|nr:hypothetical protein [Deltaproteobacteria bacterium]
MSRASASELADRIAVLADDERSILEVLLERMGQGRQRYGVWNVDDGREYPAETLDEVIDALHYCAAALVRLRRRAGQ